MVQKEKDKQDGNFKIHNVGFYNLAPRQIKCLSYNKNKCKLAVSRDDASIEIWDMKHAVYMQKCILGRPSSSVECIGWLDNRLFSTGQTGELIEWDLKELQPKQKRSLTGNAAWCMDIDELNGCIAVGTHEGYMNTFAVSGDDLNFEKLFDKQDGSIFCCKYDSSGKYIVSGSTDTIRIWNVATGHVMHRMATGRSEKNKETNVWSLVVLKDLTIIAGDSRGCITFWNGSNGTLIDKLTNILEADVLAVAVNDDETALCVSGVDPRIHIYASTVLNAGSKRSWIRNFRRSIHDHDVKALTFNGGKIISGGIDGFIKVSSSQKMYSFKECQYGPFLPQPCAVVAQSSRLLLLKYFNYLEVWRLGQPNDYVQLSEDDNNGQRKFLSLDKNREKLFEKRSKEPITCASISSNGLFLIYSTETTVRLYQLDVQSKPTLTNVKVDSDKFTACAKVLFSSDSKTLYCVKSSGDIEIFSLSYNEDVVIKASISTKKVIKDTLSLVCLSQCERYLVCAGTCGNLAVWKNNNNQWSFFKNLPNRHCAPTAMAIHNNSCRIVVAFSDYKIFDYDLKKDVIVCTTDDHFVDKLPTRFANTTHTAVNNILLDENNENVVILQNDSSLFVLKNDSVPTTKKKRKSEPTDVIESSAYYKLEKNIGNYEHFVHLSWLSSSEIVAINVNPVTLIEQLPPSMRRKQFGIS